MSLIFDTEGFAFILKR